MHEPLYHTDLYLRNVLQVDRLRKTVDRVQELLHGLDFDAFAFRGMSGACISPSVSLAMNKTLLMVRKLSDFQDGNSHSRNVVSGDRNARRYIILDDCVCTGTTVCEIMKEVYLFAPEAECLGYVQIDSLMANCGTLEPIVTSWKTKVSESARLLIADKASRAFRPYMLERTYPTPEEKSFAQRIAESANGYRRVYSYVQTDEGEILEKFRIEGTGASSSVGVS